MTLKQISNIFSWLAKPRTLLLVVIISLLTVPLKPAEAQNNFLDEESICTLHQPPNSAKVSVLQAFTLKEFPASIPDKYTGCKRVWLEDNSVLSTARFRDGRLVSVEVSEPKGKHFFCYYSEGTLIKGQSGKDCPYADEWR